MNILLLLPISSSKEIKNEFDNICQELIKAGHKVNSDVLKTDSEDFVKEAEQDIIKLYKSIENNFKTADIIIADISVPSSGIGFLVARALNEKKHTLALYKTDSITKPPVPIKANVSKLLTYKDYTYELLSATIKSFVESIKGKIDTKFILIISPEIERYLEWAGDQKRMHKAQIVRNAVEKMMEEDAEWKEYVSKQ